MHLEACLEAGIELTGTNAEVALGQWEYQCLGKGIKAADDLWVSRYLLYKIAEDAIDAYGSDNDKRLTGLHETQSIDKFSYGISDRGASIRIPIHTVEHNWNGYLEDRRPASNADPYRIINHIVDTLS